MTAPAAGSRALAVRVSGWSARFRFVQPRNLAFWVYCGLVAAGVVILTRYTLAESAVYGEVVVVSIVLFGLYGALFWWFTERIDRYAHQSRKLIVVAFLWGAFAAAPLMAASANTPILSLWGKAFGQSWSIDWGAGLTAPFVEELSKGVGLIMLIALAPRLVATAFDGFILGAFIGLGFQLSEDVLYALTSAGAGFGANPVLSALQTIVVRMLTGVAAHILYSAIFCAGLAYFLGRPAESRRRGRGLLLMGTAMLLHGVWDDTGGILGASAGVLAPIAWLVLIGLAVLAVTRVFAMTVPPEQEFMREVMAPEVAAGVITAEELDTLAGDRRARKAYRRAARGHGDARRRAHLLHAARDLADELARDGGRTTPRVRHARSEVARLRA